MSKIFQLAPLLLALLCIVACKQSDKKSELLSTKTVTEDIRNELTAFISSIHVDSIGGNHPEVEITKVSPGVMKVSLKFQFRDTVKQDDWRVTIKPAFTPTFQWAPHLTPTANGIIAQHLFRAPAMIMTDDKKEFAIVPDLNLFKEVTSRTWYMDLPAAEHKMTLGVSRSKLIEHVLYERDGGMVYPPGEFHFGFYVLTTTDAASLKDPWRMPLAFQWQTWGKPLYDEGQPIKGDLSPYVKHAYNWAFNSWSKNVWQEFTLNGKRVGAPVFIVNVTQSPNYPGEVNEREFRSIWNQAWFSSLRSAVGLYRYAKRNNDQKLLQKALMTKELALAFPQKDGLFPGVIATEMETIKKNGQELARSKGWGTYYFGNSDRNPLFRWGQAEKSPYHILDMSWTTYLMLTWYDELEKDERLLAYSKRYADKLVTMQDADGFFPAWLEKETMKPIPQLAKSPETSMSVTFLLKLYSLTKDKRYLDAAGKAMDAVAKHIIPVSQWEDFETYWSCSTVLDTLVGKKIKRNDAFKQNTLSMFWTAEALYNFYQVTEDKRYLVTGQRVLDELLMYQASWQPPFIPIRALGGFGVMNGDGEWNDSRQSLFAELIINYGKVLHQEEYIERGLSALKAAFVMMYCPENPETRAQWEKVYPFFNEKDYGFMMENYGHGGETNAEGLGIGEFTIYDWGNGAAAEAFNRIMDHDSKLIQAN